MVKAGKVSVWVGDITSEDDLLSYVDDGGFERDFNLYLDPRVKRELVASGAVLPIEKLVEGFSWWKSFIQQCIKKGTDIGISEGKCMVVLYAFEYSPSAEIGNDFPIRFIDSFEMAEK